MLSEIPTEVTHIPGDEVGCAGRSGASQDRPVLLREVHITSEFRGQHRRLSNLNLLQESFESDPLVFSGEVPPSLFNGVARG